MAAETVSPEHPHLNPEQEREAEHRTSVRAKVVHEAIRRDGEVEMARGASALTWSAFAAGLAMGLSFLTEALLKHYLPADAHWAPLVVKLGYAVGFMVVILGKQQLFTENTLTPIIPLMHERTAEKLGKVVTLWFFVLLGNLLGAHVIAWFFAATPVLRPEFHIAFAEVAQRTTEPDFGTMLLRGIPAGWLIATIVWLRAAMDSGELAMIVIVTWLVGISEFTHVIAGSVNYLYLAVRGDAAWTSWLMGFLVPVLIGNILGGVSITAALNHAQVAAEQ
jgi:formate/nitrite transporter FocA (FNT family)